MLTDKNSETTACKFAKFRQKFLEKCNFQVLLKKEMTPIYTNYLSAKIHGFLHVINLQRKDFINPDWI